MGEHLIQSRRGIRPYEVPITDKVRTREASKKLTWRDGVKAVLIPARERLAPGLAPGLAPRLVR